MPDLDDHKALTQALAQMADRSAKCVLIPRLCDHAR